MQMEKHRSIIEIVPPQKMAILKTALTHCLRPGITLVNTIGVSFDCQALLRNGHLSWMILGRNQGAITFLTH